MKAKATWRPIQTVTLKKDRDSLEKNVGRWYPIQQLPLKRK